MRYLVFVLLAVCATPQSSERGGPRGLRASEHLDAAREHDYARERGVWSIQGDVPWVRTWDAAAEHEQLAREHRSLAAALNAAYDIACRDKSIAIVAVSPLTRYGMSATNTSTGVVVELNPLAGGADDVLSTLRCHRAWLMLEPTPWMSDCALDLPGLHVEARGERDVITLVMTVRDPKLIPELQHRVASELAETHREGHED